MRNSVMCVAFGVRGQVLPSVIFEFFGGVSSTMSAIRSWAWRLVNARFRFDIGDVVGQRVSVHRTIIDRHAALRVDPRQRVLHRVLVVAVGEVLARVSAAAFGTVL